MPLMSSLSPKVSNTTSQNDDYELELQIGYLLRLANQKHLEIFSSQIPELTPTQFSVLVKLSDVGELSQNELGRRVGMDSATTNGVVERLLKKRYVQSLPDISDKRRRNISLTLEGRSLVDSLIPKAKRVTSNTLNALDKEESFQLVKLLKKLLE